MKNPLIIAFAICVLFLSACGSLVRTSTSASTAAAQSRGPLARLTPLPYKKGEAIDSKLEDVGV